MVLNRLLSIPLNRNDSQTSRNSATPEPSSPTGSSASSVPENEEEDTDPSIHLPALASPTNVNPASPWPFGQAPATRERSLSNATATTLSAKRPSLSLDKLSPSALPHEILLAILKLVSTNSDFKSCILVCKSWCQCGVELLWHKPYISHPNALARLLGVLSDSRQTFHYNEFVRRVNLSLLSSSVDDTALVQLAPCRRIERLTLSGSTSISDRGLSYLLDQCRSLVALDLSDCTQLSDLSCLSISKNCKRLQGLNLSGCRNLADAGICAIAGECKELRRVKLRGLENLTDAGIIALATSCPMLLELDLYNCSQVSDPALQAVWRHLGHVRELTVNGTQLTDESFPVVDASGKPTIRHQDFLSSLNGDNNQKVYVPVPTSHFDHMRYLDLTSQTNLTDATVESIVTFMPKVRNLLLSKCTGLTDESINSICRLGKNLHYLHLSHVSQISDRSVVRLARACSRLRYIDLACCTQLTDLSVFELALLPRLKRVGLVRVTNLTDDAVFALAERKTLERIHLSYCDRISVQAIHFLLQGLHHLTHLSLTGVPAFRSAELQTFCRPPPREFNTHQQQTFCVFSGRGVSELRQYLVQNVRNREDEVSMAEQQQQQVALQMQRNVFMRQNPHYQPNGNPLSANPVAANAVPHRRRRPRQAPQEAQGLLPQDIQPSVMPATRHNENTLGRAPVSNGLIPAGLGSSAAMPMPIPSTSRAASAMPFEPARGASRQQQFGPLINPYAPYRSRAASADGDFARPAQSSSAPASLDSFAHLPQQLATPEFAAAPSRPSQLPVEQQNARFAALLRGDRTPMEEDEGEMDEEGYDEEEGADHALAVMRSSGRRHFQQQHSVQNRPW